MEDPCVTCPLPGRLAFVALSVPIIAAASRYRSSPAPRGSRSARYRAPRGGFTGRLTRVALTPEHSVGPGDPGRPSPPTRSMRSVREDVRDSALLRSLHRDEHVGHEDRARHEPPSQFLVQRVGTAPLVRETLRHVAERNVADDKRHPALHEVRYHRIGRLTILGGQVNVACRRSTGLWIIDLVELA